MIPTYDGNLDQPPKDDWIKEVTAKREAATEGMADQQIADYMRARSEWGKAALATPPST